MCVSERQEELPVFSLHVLVPSCAVRGFFLNLPLSAGGGELTTVGARKPVIGTEREIGRPMGEQSCYLHMKSCR